MNERAKSIEKNIKQYINFFAASEVKTRGKRLFENNAVTLQGYDEKRDTWQFAVKGTLNYRVKIKGTKSIALDTSCNCPYEWGSVCKHRVAALYYIAETVVKGEKPVAKAALISNATRHGKKGGYLLNSYKNITTQFITKNAFARVVSDLYYQGVTTSYTNIEIKTNEIDFIANNKSFNVSFFREGEFVYINSHGSKNAQKLTLAEALCLHKIANSPMPDVLDKIFSGEIKGKEKVFLSGYGLPETTDFDEYFEYCFGVKMGLFYNTKPKAEGLLPIKPSDNFFLDLDEIK